MNKYIFIDRDGVINKDPGGWTKYGYVTRFQDFYFLPGVHDALRKLKSAGYCGIIISNQQGVGRGHFTKKALDGVTKKMLGSIKETGGDLAGVYYCVHSKEENCPCRKPKTGLFLKAKKKFGIKSFKGKFFIGDTERDMQAAKDAGLKSILVFSGKTAPGDEKKWKYKPDYTAEGLFEAVKIVVKTKL